MIIHAGGAPVLNGQAQERRPRPWPSAKGRPPRGGSSHGSRSSAPRTTAAEQPQVPGQARVLSPAGTAPPHTAALEGAAAAAHAEHQAATRSASVNEPMQAFVLDVPVTLSSGDDEGASDEPSVQEQLSEIAQMLRTMQFDITTLKRTNRRQ